MQLQVRGYGALNAHYETERIVKLLVFQSSTYQHFDKDLMMKVDLSRL
ncbi:MAG: hypothetical protein U0136_21980 [Bdellovibrionota bacterium]